MFTVRKSNRKRLPSKRYSKKEYEFKTLIQTPKRKKINPTNQPNNKPISLFSPQKTMAFNVLKNTIASDLATTCIREIEDMKKKWEKIFVDENKYDAFRQQIKIKKHELTFSPSLWRTWQLVEQKIMEIYPSYQLDLIVSIIKSLPGGKSQKIHQDFDSSDGKFNEHPPLSIILSLSGKSAIDISDLKNENHKRSNTLNAGDLMIFHGFVNHNGRSYKETNYRLHWYCTHQDVTKEVYSNSTYFVK